MNYQDMLHMKLSKEIADIPSETVAKMVTALDEYRAIDYWPTKNIRLSNLLPSQEVVDQVLRVTLGFNTQIQEIVARLAYSISKSGKYVERLQNAVNVLECLDNAVYRIERREDVMVRSFWQLETDTYDYINLRKYEPPMLQEPKDWSCNEEGGYFTEDIGCILGSTYNMHREPQALDVLNQLQQIIWELDPVVLALEEEPNKEFVSPQSHEQFMTMAEASRKTYQTYKDKSFWFIWQFDKRGRQYSRGYHINLQSSGYKKALLNFENKEMIHGT